MAEPELLMVCEARRREERGGATEQAARMQFHI